MFKRIIAVTLLALLFTLVLMPSVFAQKNLDNVRLFQSYHFDTPITKNKIAEGDVSFANFEGGSSFSLGGRGSYPVNEKIQVDAQLHFTSVNPDYEGADGQSGLSDIGIYGRYLIQKRGRTTFSAGGLLTLPIGSDKIYMSNYSSQSLMASRLNFGGFGAMRHELADGMIVTANAGLSFLEVPKIGGSGGDWDNDDFNFEDDDFWEDWANQYGTDAVTAQTASSDSDDSEYKTSFNIGAGIIYPYSAEINIVGEFFMMSEFDYMMLSGGGDYVFGRNAKIRGMIGLGLDDGAPDFMIMAGYEMTL